MPPRLLDGGVSLCLSRLLYFVRRGEMNSTCTAAIARCPSMLRDDGMWIIIENVHVRLP